jgi:hypothetical protein
VKFAGKSLSIRQVYLTYIELEDWNERYEFHQPEMSFHNFIIGKPYIDLGDHMTVLKVGTNEKAIVNFRNRPWFAKETEIAKLDGHVISE